MLFTNGKLRSYEQLMRQSPRRPPANESDEVDEKKSQTNLKSRPIVTRKENANGKQCDASN